MRRLLAAVVAAVLVIALAAPALASAPAKKATVGDFYFHPGKLTIKRGTKVVWHFVSGYHNIVSSKSPAKVNAGFRRAPATFSFTFKKPGVYHLHCTIHHGMNETVIVK